MKCRFCNHILSYEFIDLIKTPLSNSFLTKEQLNEPEVFYPLRLLTCEKCFLVQIDEKKKVADIFNHDYAYFSSYSKSWLNHASAYVDMITERFGYNTSSRVMEIASNDGYLLQFFKKKNIPALGVEPAKNTAQVAIEKGIETITDFFCTRLAKEIVLQNRKTDLIIGNNVLAHVPDVNDFVAAMKIVLNDGGVITMEFPYLMELIQNTQFDTIYHEHFSYFSFCTVNLIFAEHGLELFDVDKIPTHGGSLRIYGKHKEDLSKRVCRNVTSLIKEEETNNTREIEYYNYFQDKVDEVKTNLLSFLLEQKKLNKQVIAYGAAAKGNTLLNYCGVKNDLIDFVVDASPHKQGKFLPGCHIPVVNEEMIKINRPDYILILAWNLKDEIIDHLKYIKEWDCKFVLPIPSLIIV